MADWPLNRYESLEFTEQVAIDRLCSSFEEALRAGANPSLEDYLQRAGLGERACLLTELVALECTYRRGEGFARDDYVARFPDFVDAIDEAFRTDDLTEPGQPPSRAAAQTPPTIDGYEILAELGKGGMGVVYKARHLRLKRVVALKLLLQGDFASEKQRARFLVESEMLARLRHPNIVQVFEAGQQAGCPFLALEYVEGGTLADRLDTEATFAPREAAVLVCQLARAMHHAHQQGVLHRDLKPGNVLLSGPIPKITDFGLACGPGGGDLSKTGQVMGTPSYMPPEQARGDRKALGPPADVYALGAVLYELLTGRPPFLAETVMDTIHQVLNDEPTPPSTLCAAVAVDLSTVCLKCLRKEPQARYTSADELADDLERWLAGEPIAARPVGRAERAWKWVRRKPAQAGFLAVSLLLVLAVIGLPTLAALRLSREQALTKRADEQRRLALVQSLHTAAPESVPFLVEALAAAPDQVLPLLRQQLDDPDLSFRAAVALTLLGDDQTDYLLTTVAAALPVESANLARAFCAAKSPRFADELHQRGRDAGSLELRIRHAILLLDLGDARLARSLLVSADPNARSTFFEVVQTWHGTLKAWAAVLDGADNEDWRAALCVAVGRVDRPRLDPEVCRSLAAALSRWFLDAPDPGTHAAAEWSLRQWRVPLPTLAGATSTRRWFVNHSGMTMLGIPPGVVWQRTSGAALPLPYFIGDREVTLGQYRQFMKDETAERPSNWGDGPSPNLKPEHPMPYARMLHVAPFCNWLSKRDGRRPCYRPDRKSPTGWVCNYTADGYRLPTEAEWDHAHRAGATTRFCFGDDARWLPLYAHVAHDVTSPCAIRLPNRWGLFDVVGNLWDATGDGASAKFGETLPTMVLRGGAFDSGSDDCLALSRTDGPMEKAVKAGFRVVCGSAQPMRQPLPDHRDERVVLAYLVRSAGADVRMIQMRGELHARYGEWKEAARDHAVLVERSEPDFEVWTTYAALLAQAGDKAGYRSMCRRLLEQYGTTLSALRAERVAKACLLAEAEGLDRVFKLLETALGNEAEDWARPYAELARGMAEYRRGDHAKALASLEGCQQRGRPEMNVECRALRGFFLALTHYKLGQQDKAAAAYEKARRLWAEQVAALEKGHNNWRDVLRATIAEAEARQLLRDPTR